MGVFRIEKKKQRFIVILLVTELTMATPVAASDTENINELFLSNVVYTQEAEELQLTLRPEYFSNSNGEHWLLSVGAEYGINKG